MDVSQQIKNLKNKNTFWDDIKKIIPPFYEDWQIKQWQIEAEEQFEIIEKTSLLNQQGDKKK